MVINIEQKLTGTLLSSLQIVLLLFTVLTGTVTYAANITVTTSRNPVAIDDSFHLIYEADSSVDGDPDFSPITTNFDILSSSQSTNMRSINGNWTMKKSWDLAVIARDIGTFTIPAVSFGNDTSPAIQVTVTNSSPPGSASPGGNASTPAKIFLESTVDKKAGWVQSQFIYTIRLLRTVGVANASLTEPVTSDPDAIIQLLGEDQYQTTRNAVHYEVFERSYAIFPQKSGTLTIKPATFEGRVNSTQPRSLFDQFRVTGQLKRVRSRALRINVKPAPADINLQDWLPAKNVQLFEEWSGDTHNIKAGEPVTRTITITAEGLTGVQLPELSFTETDGLKLYPDKAVTENRQEANGITGIKQIKVALIPASAGSYTLPEVRLQWWNTKTGNRETATLAPVTLNVTGGVQSSRPAPSPTQSQNTAIPDKPLAITSQDTHPGLPIAQLDTYWKWLTLLFAAAWFITLVLLLKKSGPAKSSEKNITKASPASVRSAANMVIKHANNNNANKTKIALIEWAQIFYNDNELTNLSQITGHCSARLGQQIKQLNQSLYSPDKTSWNGTGLITIFKDEQQLTNTQKNEQPSALKPLYSE